MLECSSGNHLVQPLCSKIITSCRSGEAWLCPVMSWKSPRVEILQPLTIPVLHFDFFRKFSQTFILNLPVAVSVHCFFWCYFLLMERFWLYQITNSPPVVVGCYQITSASHRTSLSLLTSSGRLDALGSYPGSPCLILFLLILLDLEPKTGQSILGAASQGPRNYV